jgi:hypothetical protein
MEPLVVREATLSSAAVVADVIWEGDTEVPPLATRDLRVPVPAFVCPVPVPGRTVVAVSYETGGSSFRATLPPADPYAVLERLSTDACVTDAVTDVVRLTLRDELTIEGSGASATALVGLSLAPTGDASAESVTISSVAATTLLSPAGGAPEWPIDASVSAEDDPRTILLPAVPARCDPHALAEDKVGTILRVEVTFPDGRVGAVNVPASDALRSALHTFVRERCHG